MECIGKLTMVLQLVNSLSWQILKADLMAVRESVAYWTSSGEDVHSANTLPSKSTCSNAKLFLPSEFDKKTGARDVGYSTGN